MPNYRLYLDKLDLKRAKLGDDSGLVEILEAVEAPQVYMVMGPFRSGTSVLTRKLYETGAFNTLTLKMLLFYDQALTITEQDSWPEIESDINDVLAGLGFGGDRGIDSLAIGPDAPEEYGPVISYGDTRLPKNMLNQENLPRFIEMIKKIGYVSKHPELPLLLKNPFDYANIFDIYKMCQDTPELEGKVKFIVNERDRVETLSSQVASMKANVHSSLPFYAVANPAWLDAYETLWKRYGLLFTIKTGICPLYMSVRAKMHDLKHEKGRAMLPDGVSYLVTYKGLCDDPEGTIDGVLDNFALPNALISSRSTAIKRRHRAPNPYISMFWPLVDKAIGFLARGKPPILTVDKIPDYLA